MIGPIHTRNRRCPHEVMHKCPLYVASHYPSHLGCVSDMALDCDVDTGRVSYEAETAKVYAAHPELLETNPPAVTGRMQ